MAKVSELLLVATTIGKGPFCPAIRMNGYTYALRLRSYDNEDEAANVSVQVLTKLKTYIRKDTLHLWNL